MAEEQKDDLDVDIITVLHRLRPDASPAFKQQFAKDFSQALQTAGVEPGAAFYLVTGPLWERLKKERDDALEAEQTANDELVNKTTEAEGMLKEAETLRDGLHDALDDFERGVIDKDEIRERLGLPALGIR